MVLQAAIIGEKKHNRVSIRCQDVSYVNNGIDVKFTPGQHVGYSGFRLNGQQNMHKSLKPRLDYMCSTYIFCAHVENISSKLRDALLFLSRCEKLKNRTYSIPNFLMLFP